MNETLIKILEWVLLVNEDIIDDEVVPGVTVEEFDRVLNELKNK